MSTATYAVSTILSTSTNSLPRGSYGSSRIYLHVFLGKTFCLTAIGCVIVLVLLASGLTTLSRGQETDMMKLFIGGAILFGLIQFAFLGDTTYIRNLDRLRHLAGLEDFNALVDLFERKCLAAHAMEIAREHGDEEEMSKLLRYFEYQGVEIAGDIPPLRSACE